jgi:hypothetical protein
MSLPYEHEGREIEGGEMSLPYEHEGRELIEPAT